MMVETLLMLNKTLNLEDYHQGRSISIAKQEDVKNTTSTPPLYAQEQKSRSGSMRKQDQLKFFQTPQQVQQYDESRSGFHAFMKHQDDSLLLISPPQASQQGKSRRSSINEKEIHYIHTPPKIKDEISMSRKSSLMKEDKVRGSRSNSKQQQAILNIETGDGKSSSRSNEEQGKFNDPKIVLINPEIDIEYKNGSNEKQTNSDQKQNDLKNSDQKNSDSKDCYQKNSDSDQKQEINQVEEEVEVEASKQNNVNMNIAYESKSKSMQNTKEDKRFLVVNQPKQYQQSLHEIASSDLLFEMRPSEQPSFRQPLSDMPSEGTDEDEEFRNSIELQMAQEHLEDEKFQEQKSKKEQQQ